MKAGVVILLMFLCYRGNSQSRFGARAGLNLSNIIFNKQDRSDTRRVGFFIPGFNGGIKAEFSIDEEWKLFSGIDYAGKGTVYGRSHATGKIDSVIIHLNYVQMPLEIGYKTELNEHRYVAWTGGFYFSYGFAGQVRFKKSPGLTQKHVHRKQETYARFESGVILGATYELNERAGIRVEYSRSIPDITRRQRRQSNQVFGVSVLWWFN